MFKSTKKLQWARHQQRWFGKWHAYLGIIAGLIVAIVGITGSILVFQDEIDIALNKELFLVQESSHKIPLGEIVPMVQQKYPSLKFDYAMDEKDKPNYAYRFYNLKTEDEFFVNPYTAILSGKRLHESSFIHTVTEIHRTLLVPVAGRYIVGIATLILLVLTISGLRLWIPKKWKQLKSVLTVNFKSSLKRQNYDWHNVIGLYSAPVVSLLALTGFCITFSAIIIPFLFLLSGQSPKGVAQIFSSKSEYKKNATALSPAQAVKIGLSQMLRSRIAGIAIPADSVGVYRLDVISPGLPKSGKREMLILDQYTGKIFLNSRKDFPDIGNAYLSWLVPIHFGTFGGRPIQVLALIGGLIPLILFITGFIIWYPRWKRQKRKVVSKSENNDHSANEHRGALKEIPQQIKLPVMQFFFLHFKKGLKYAGWGVLIAAIMGAIYGLISGIIVQPAVFSVTYTTVLVVVNFLIALLVIVFNIIFLAPFKKGSRSVIKYFSLSFGFFIVFFAAYLIIMNTGFTIF